MKSGSRTFGRWMVAAGAVVSVAAWWRRLEPLPEEPDDAPLDDAAMAAGAFEIELTRARRAPRSRRFASTLLFVTLFCAGAAFTAGAGNQVAHTDEATVADGAAQAAPAPDPATAPGPAAAADPAATAEPAPAAPPAPETVPAPQAAPAATPEAPSAADPVPAAPDDVTPTTAPARPDYVAPASVTARPAPSAAPAGKHETRKRQPAKTRRVASRPSPLLPAAASFVPAIPFDLQAWEHDNPASSIGATAAAIAQHYIGTPYVWGGASPSGGFDCSGLMQFVYGRLGIPLPHYAAAQFAIFPRLEASQLQAGDLVFFEPKLDGPGHVAMYLGGDAIVEAPHTGALVRIGSLSRSAAALGFMGAVRPYGAAATATRLIAAHDSTRASTTGPGPAESALSV